MESSSQQTPSNGSRRPVYAASTSSVAAGTPLQLRSTAARSRPRGASVSSQAINNDDSEDDHLNEVIMAVNVRERGSVGCAYYSAREEKLYCMEDMKMGGIEVAEALKAHISPTTILVPYSIEDAFIDALDPQRGQSPPGDTQDDMCTQTSVLPYQLDFRVSGEFRYESGRNKLIGLRLPSHRQAAMSFNVPGELSEVDQQDDLAAAPLTGLGSMLSMGSAINLESRLTIGCVGAVINYLQRRRAAVHLPQDEAADSMFRIFSVHMFSLGGSMFVNLDALVSLQIIRSESHPHAQNQGPRTSGSKEGLSLYGLFHHFARTPQGKALLRQMFLRPSVDLDMIQQRLDVISTMLRPDNQPGMECLVTHLKAIKNARAFIARLHKGTGGGSDAVGGTLGANRTIWSGIRLFIYHVLEIGKNFAGISSVERLQIYHKFMAHHNEVIFGNIGVSISSIIDFEETLSSQTTIIKEGVDQELDELRRFYAGIEQLLSHVAAEISREVPTLYNAQINVVLWPQLGFLVGSRLIPDTASGVYEGNDEEKWDSMFCTDEFAYYKNSQVREMDARFGDVHAQIAGREIEIIQQLTEEILKHEDLLATMSDICGELDSLLALTQGAREYNLCRPAMTHENVLDIRGGRHLLQERTVPTFIANDAVLVGGEGTGPEQTDDDGPVRRPARSTQASRRGPSMLMVTGPNFSGKSVYLKQVALIAFMAHVGSFVPADAATIGITDKILTRIWTRESVSRYQSAFMIDLQQMSLALGLATRRSLLIIDEFGKGTESYDGAGLAAGVFSRLLSLGPDRPKVVAATHYHEILESPCLLKYPTLSFVNMQILLSTPSTVPSPSQPATASRSLASTGLHAEAEAQEVTYLYTLVPGKSSSSYGTVCASMNGVPRGVVARAEELIELSDRGEDLVAACATLSAEEKEDLRDAEAVVRKFLMADMGGDGVVVSPRALLEDILSA